MRGNFYYLLIVAVLGLAQAQCSKPISFPAATRAAMPSVTSEERYPTPSPSSNNQPRSSYRGWIAFLCDQDTKIDLCLLSPDFESTERLGISEESIGFPYWSHDYSSIAYIRTTAHELHIIDLDCVNDQEKDCSESAKVYSIEDKGTIYPQLAWSPDGESVVYSMRPEGSTLDNLYRLWLGDRSVEQLDVIGDQPSWDPNGEFLAYRSSDLGSIKILELATGHVTVLLEANLDLHEFSDPEWSPDGKRIAFIGATWGHDGENPRATAYVYLHDMETKEIIPLTQADDAILVSWSPDSTMLLFDRSDGTYIINIDGSGLRKIIANQPTRGPLGGSWSP